MEDKRRVVSRRALMKAATVVPFAAVRGTAANSAVKVGLLGAGGRGSRVSSFVVTDQRARLVALLRAWQRGESVNLPSTE
jgi:hypothetical protein